MAGHRAKQMKIWDSRYHSAHMQSAFDARFLEFGLGSFCALCKIFDSTFFETLLSFNTFHQIATKLHTTYHNQGLMQAVTFFGNMPKIENSMGLFKFLSTQDYMELEIQNATPTTVFN